LAIGAFETKANNLQLSSCNGDQSNNNKKIMKVGKNIAFIKINNNEGTISDVAMQKRNGYT
jgi:hypothetical protein